MDKNKTPEKPCRGCGKPLIWFVNENGKAEPFDLKPTRTLVTVVDKVIPDVAPHTDEVHVKMEIRIAHLPHFVTCPQASQFRKN